MIETMTALARPWSSPPPTTVEGLARLSDWAGFCALVANAGCAALLHERLREHDHAVPRNVSAWLQVQHAQTRANNRRLLEELHRITGVLDTCEIPALILKGPVLALLGTGLSVRPFHDLDLLVRPEDLVRTMKALRPLGFAEVRSEHPYHRILVRAAAPATVIEVHFDLIDAERGYTPTLSGIWTRAGTFDLPECTVSAPSITDHLLLTIMQLPHHHWDPRVMIDVAYLFTRWGGVIDWERFAHEAHAWRMRVLTGATLRATASLLELALPPAVSRLAEPGSYLERVQWRLVEQALLERFRLGPPRIGRAASCVVVDRPAAMLPLAVRTVLKSGGQGGWSSIPRVGRRFWMGMASVPALLASVSEIALAGRQRSANRRSAT